MTEKRRRRAVGPVGARPATEEPLPEREDDREQDRRDLERYLAERPPHHEPR
jgi:hypothetical protein